ncbi:S16 family serine protease [Streptomyces boninensis]|uniref:S16 family serine protease n=1 Tax=Streptomyces boninensis TaxID=2039455 RepID=UPI003B2227B5
MPQPSRPVLLALCALPVVGLLATAAFAPLPFSVAKPGQTTDVLGEDGGKPVITLSGDGVEPRKTSGELRMTTIVATGPGATVKLGDVLSGWFATDEAVMPRDSVYPVGDTTEEVRDYNADQMKQSQDDATAAARAYLGKSADDLNAKLRLVDVGGPSAGLMFTLGIIDKYEGNGAGGDLTGGRKIAGTGTIEEDGKVGAVGGVPLKTQAAKRDGATVFLVPAAECGDAKSELPEGLRLIPVKTLSGAVGELKALESGGKVSSC